MDLLNRMHKMSNVITITVVYLIKRLCALYDEMCVKKKNYNLLST